MAEKKIANPISVRLTDSEKEALNQVCIDNSLDRVTIAEGIRFLLGQYQQGSAFTGTQSSSNYRQLESILEDMKDSGLFGPKELIDYESKLKKARSQYKSDLSSKFAKILKLPKTK